MGLIPIEVFDSRFAHLRSAILMVALVLGPVAGAAAQEAPETQTADFGKLSAKLTADRANADDESEAVEQQALAILDRAALEQLNSATPNLEVLNQRLATFVTHEPPVGEGYRVVPLGGDRPSYALIADFGLGGPSAVRLYSGAAGHLKLAARVDRYAQTDFFDDYLDLAPIGGSDGVFVTISGRTDDLETGIFTAWRFDSQRVIALWTSDILEQSSYEIDADGFWLTYCAESDVNDFRVCTRRERDRYVWQDGAWKRIEAVTLPPSPVKP